MPSSETEVLAVPDDPSSTQLVSQYLGELFPAVGTTEAAQATIPWLCDVCPSPHSRRAYLRDLAQFVHHMKSVGNHPLNVTGDEIRIYKEALTKAKQKASTISRTLSVLRGAYEQFGKKGMVAWDVVADIQAVKSPPVKKNTTPALTEAEAKDLLHKPDITTVVGARDHAMLFVYFKTTCRAMAIANATVGHLEHRDTAWYLAVTEKRKKETTKALLDSAAAVFRWLAVANINHETESDAPLFPAIEKDRKTVTRRYLSSRQILNIVKKYARASGIQVERRGRRGVCTHSLRKTALTNALRHGAGVLQVKALADHSSVRTTELYYESAETDAEDAARHIQIR